jgi:hypothetical protein
MEESLDRARCRLLAAAERIRGTRFPRHSAYCGGEERVADGIDAPLWRAWLADCLRFAERAWGPKGATYRRLAARLEADASVDALDGVLADLLSAKADE